MPATASGARPYTSTRTGEKDVFIHPSSTLFREAPTMVVFQEMVETSLPYMKGVTAIEPKWLAKLVPSMCLFGKPLENPPPRYVTARWGRAATEGARR